MGTAQAAKLPADGCYATINIFYKSLFLKPQNAPACPLEVGVFKGVFLLMGRDGMPFGPVAFDRNSALAANNGEI